MEICQVDGCNRKHYVKGHCEKHNKEMQICGRILPVIKCKFEGCDEERFKEGYCHGCYMRMYKP